MGALSGAKLELKDPDTWNFVDLLSFRWMNKYVGHISILLIRYAIIYLVICLQVMDSMPPLPPGLVRIVCR
jgi:hypothetical protein